MRNTLLVFAIALILSPAWGQETRVHFDIGNGNVVPHLFIPCHVSQSGAKGKKKKFSCLIDTGFYLSVVDPEVAKRFAFARAMQEMPTSTGTQEVSVAELLVQIGSEKKSYTLKALVLPASGRVGGKIVLGEDFLSKFSSVNIDYKRGVITFVP